MDDTSANLPERKRLQGRNEKQPKLPLMASAVFDFSRFAEPAFLREMAEARSEVERDTIMDRWMEMTPEQVEEKRRTLPPCRSSGARSRPPRES